MWCREPMLFFVRYVFPRTCEVIKILVFGCNGIPKFQPTVFLFLLWFHSSRYHYFCCPCNTTSPRTRPVHVYYNSSGHNSVASTATINLFVVRAVYSLIACSSNACYASTLYRFNARSNNMYMRVACIDLL